MSDPELDNIWTFNIDLPEGIHHYYFAADNESIYENLPLGSPCTEFFQSFNSRVITIESDTVLPAGNPA
jgi:hypothetical protein